MMGTVFGRMVCKSNDVAYGHSAKLAGDRGNSESLGNKDEHDLICSICLEPLVDRTTVKLRCSHLFHLDCIGSAFNEKSKMQCPICRCVEQGQWLYANHPTTPDIWLHLAPGVAADESFLQRLWNGDDTIISHSGEGGSSSGERGRDRVRRNNNGVRSRNGVGLRGGLLCRGLL